jgi:hypothetical protein
MTPSGHVHLSDMFLELLGIFGAFIAVFLLVSLFFLTVQSF